MSSYNKYFLFVNIFVLALIFGLGVVLAWTNPTGNPPTGAGAIQYSSSNVGIGSAPSGTNKLTVSGNEYVNGILRVGTNAGGSSVGDIVARRAASQGFVYFGDSTSNYFGYNGTYYQWGTQTGGGPFVEYSTGNVGINDASPDGVLDVYTTLTGYSPVFIAESSSVSNALVVYANGVVNFQSGVVGIFPSGFAGTPEQLRVQYDGAGVGIFVGGPTMSAFGNALIETNGLGGTTHLWFAENGTRIFSVSAAGYGYFASTVRAASPIASDDVATKGYVDALAGGLQWMGYTASAYTGNLGTVKGANAYCDANYAGSHWASFDEVVRLGSSYPWTYQVWVRDAIAGLHVDSGTGSQGFSLKDSSVYWAGYNDGTCSNWSSGAGSPVGSSLYTTGGLALISCSNAFRLPCVK